MFWWRVKTKTILCTNHLGWKENSLATNDWDPVELSRESCHQFPQRNLPPAAPKLFLISHLVGKSSFNGVFSFLCHRWNVQDKWAFCGFGRFGLCVFIFSTWYVMTCHGTKDNTGLLKKMTLHGKTVNKVNARARHVSTLKQKERDSTR